MSVAKKTARATTARTDEAWRLQNAGRILGNAVTRFETRVLALMAQAGYTETRLSHVNLTRHLDLDGTRITELARRARMTNAAMTELIDQCERMGLVLRQADPADGRARVVMFTEPGRRWLAAFGKALQKAERELVREIGQPAAEALYGPIARYAGAIQSLAAGEEAG